MDLKSGMLVATSLSSALCAYLYYKQAVAEQSRKNELAMDLCGLRNMNMESDESKINGTSKFKPNSSDVFIVTYPKCGTTWMTQICHMLRGGDMNFGEITEVVPWDVMTLTCGQDLNAEQVIRRSNK